jgi:excisionase family DNA binding protein
MSSGTAVRTPVREYLTPEEAAELLSIHVQTLRAHVRSGKLPALRLAGERAIRIRWSDLEKIFEPANQAD